MTARSRSLSTPALVLVAALLSTGMVGAAGGMTVWKCVEDATLYLHRPQPGETTDPVEGLMDEDAPQEVAPSVRPDFSGPYPLWTRIVLGETWVSTIDQANICGARGTVYAAAPTSTSVATTRLEIGLMQGEQLMDRYSRSKKRTIPQSATPVPIDFHIDSPNSPTDGHHGPVTMRVFTILDDVPSPAILAYDSVDYPSHVVTSVWIACEQGDPDPDPRCHEG